MCVPLFRKLLTSVKKLREAASVTDSNESALERDIIISCYSFVFIRSPVSQLGLWTGCPDTFRSLIQLVYSCIAVYFTSQSLLSTFIPILATAGHFSLGHIISVLRST
jgi:hypothetical protein